MPFRQIPEGGQLTFEMPCTLAAVRPAVGRVVAFLQAHGCAEKDVFASEVALTEICNNAVQYARPPATEPVLIEVRCGMNALEMQVSDHTNGFDFAPLPEMPDEASDSGRGLALVGKLMHEVRYARGQGSNVFFLKLLLKDPI